MSAQNQKVTGVLGGIAGMVGLSAIAGVLVTVMVTPALAVTGMAASNTIGIFESLPEYIRINEQSQRNVLYAQNTANPEDGYTAFATVFAENREEVAWDDVSQYIKDATVAGEDRRFYDHNGVDVQGIVRAAIGNLASGGIESGASTLTMQLVKNIFITEALKADTIEERDALIARAQEQTLERKLQEAKFAIGLEKEYTKDEILLAYLNVAGFGGNTYGIQAAAQQYFGVNAADVTIAQAASLVAIVQEPGARSLGDPENYPRNQERRDDILGFMYGEGYITEAEYREAIGTPVDEEFVSINPPRSGCFAANDYTKFFCDFVVKSVKDLEALGSTEEERLDAWSLGGYDIYTTLNLSLQTVTQDRLWEVVAADIPQTNLGGVAVQIENGTGRVLSLAINKRFDNRSPEFGGGTPGTTAVNYATDFEYGGSRGFPTGSTYKIFTLIEWLEQNRGLLEVIDTTRNRLQQSAFTDTCEDGGGPWVGVWPLGNFSPAPPALSVWDSTVESVNTAFAAMAEQLDLCEIRRTAEAMGVHRADGAPLQTNPSGILGTNEIAPLTMAAAYATVGASGIYCEPIIVDRIVDRDGEDLPGQQQECRRAISEEVSAAAMGPMLDVVTVGTARASNTRDGIPVIGKTGTSDEAKHIWMAGGSTEVTTTVWIGNVVGSFNLSRLPGGLGLRHEVFRIAQAEANRQYGGGSFPGVPSRLLNGSGVTLPEVAGLTAEQAKELLEGLGFRFELGEQVDSDLAKGLIVSSSPSSGTLLARGQTVTVTVSLGNLITVPDVSSDGLSTADAIAALNEAGFSTVNQNCQELPEGSPPEQDDIVVGQSPAAGTKVRFGTPVVITVARLDCG